MEEGKECPRKLNALSVVVVNLAEFAFLVKIVGYGLILFVIVAVFLMNFMGCPVRPSDVSNCIILGILCAGGGIVLERLAGVGGK